MTLDRERTRDSIDGRHLECWCWGSFWLYWTVKRKNKGPKTIARTKNKVSKRKEKKKKVVFAEARTRTLWHAKQRLYPLSHDGQHTKSETNLSR